MQPIVTNVDTCRKTNDKIINSKSHLNVWEKDETLFLNLAPFKNYASAPWISKLDVYGQPQKFRLPIPPCLQRFFYFCLIKIVSMADAVLYCENLIDI